jgi:hypothetical protein
VSRVSDSGDVLLVGIATSLAETSIEIGSFEK